jgi:hypothetical protein
MEQFNFCGKISLGKETPKFSPVDRREFTSGWMSTTVRFTCQADTNRVLCVAQGGKWKQDSKNAVKTLSKTYTDENGKKVKGQSIEIAWDKRFDEEEIAKVAGFKKFTVDTGDVKQRYLLKDVINAFEKNEITDEMLEQAGVSTKEEAEAALKKNEAKRKSFISEWDFAEYVAKVAASEKFKDKLFYVNGYYDVQRNPENGNWYTNYRVNSLVLAKEDAKASTEMKMTVYFTEDCIDDESFEENGKAFLNGYINYYDGNVKATGFKPVCIVIRDEKLLKGIKKKLSAEENEVKSIGVVINVIEGAERKEIKLEDLDEETRDEIECGLLDFEEVRKALGGNTVGNRISELRFDSLWAEKRNVEDTTYTVEDLQPAQSNAKVETIDDDDDSDIPFDIDDEDDDL